MLGLRERRPKFRRFPAAAKGFVEGDEIGGNRPVALDERVLRLIEGAFGVQHVDETGQAGGIELIGQVQGFLAGLDGVSRNCSLA